MPSFSPCLKKAPAGHSTLNARERKAVNATIGARKELDGNIKHTGASKALAVLSSCLDAHGLVLDMVTGDMLMGEKGSRHLTISRRAPEGSDPFTPGVQIENSRVCFTWENLGTQFAPRVEVIAYLS